MSLFSLDSLLGLILPILLSAVKAIIDEVVNGAELNVDQRRLLFTAWVESHLWAAKIVEGSLNEYDDQALEALWSAMEDIAGEAGLTLPEIPEF